MPEGHDDFGRLVRVVSPDSSTTRYLYDESGNLIEKTDATGTVTAYEYDAMNRLVQVERADPNTALTSSERYIYDVCRAGSLCGVVDASGRTDYSYDGLGRLVVESRMQGDRAFVTAYFYDALGRMSAMIYPSGRTLTYAYQAADPSRLDSIGTVVDGDPVTVVDNITYDESGTIATYTLGNSSVVTRANNLSHELTALESTPVLDFGYQRDGVGNITQIADATIGTRNFGYDPQDRLTDLSWGASGPTGPELHWSYDKAGNRLTAITGASPSCSQRSRNSWRPKDGVWGPP